MISILLTVLKVLGIILLSLIGILVLLILLVLFVPVRYRIYAERKPDKMPLSAKLKATWLFHLLNVHFDYPDAVYVKVRLGCITLFRSDRAKEKQSKGKSKQEAEETTETALKAETDADSGTTRKAEAGSDGETTPKAKAESKAEIKPDVETAENSESPSSEEDKGKEADKEPSVKAFFKKFFDLLRNLQYTIAQICDKIKKIVKNIKYYIEVISSSKFKNALQMCGTQVGALLRHICPRKIKGSLRIGTGDPAGTGQVLAVYGMLYPFLGGQIAVTPDFEQQIVEGELLIKGRITLFRLVRCAWIVYFNKNLRQVISMLKREAV
ncbi:MAG: DUF2953 domain-containing protein [Lachnospiraceae bacterium]|nr:DUF2953 domain-containing protein [Lachnospiraceae bacterium]